MGKRHLVRDEPTPFDDGVTYCGRRFMPSERNGRHVTDVRRVNCKHCLVFSGHAPHEANVAYSRYPEVERPCGGCGEPFTTRNPNKVYCSNKCKERAKTHRLKHRDDTDPYLATERLPRRLRLTSTQSRPDYGSTPPPDRDYFKRLGCEL